MSIAVNDSTDMITNTNNGVDVFVEGNTSNPTHYDVHWFWCTHLAVNGNYLPDCSTTPHTPDDTQVQLDPVNYQWMVTALSSNGKYVYMAVSDFDSGSGPSQWFYYYLPACNRGGGTYFGDQPFLGVTNGLAFLDVRCFQPGTPPNPEPDTIYELDLPAMEQGVNLDIRIQSISSPSMSLRPATTASEITKQWFVSQMTDATGANIYLYYIDTAGGTSTALSFYKKINIDPSAVGGRLPLQDQYGCPTGDTSCYIDSGIPVIDSAMTQVQSTSNHTFLFATFATRYLPNTSNTLVELFGIDFGARTYAALQDITCPNPGYPSLVFGRTNALYLHYATFYPTAYAEVCNNLYYYYPLGSMYEYGSDTPLVSRATFTGQYDATVQGQRWGDYSGSNFVTNSSINFWPANIWELDEFTKSGTDQSTIVSG